MAWLDKNIIGAINAISVDVNAILQSNLFSGKWHICCDSGSKECPANSTTDLWFTFPKAFSQVPIAIGGVCGELGFYPITEISAQITNVSKSGCNLKIQNVTGNPYTPKLCYIAIGLD